METLMGLEKESFTVEEESVLAKYSNPGPTLSRVVALPSELTRPQREDELFNNSKHGDIEYAYQFCGILQGRGMFMKGKIVIHPNALRVY